MKIKQFSLLVAIFSFTLILNQNNLFAQTICNSAANVVIYSNYDGGPLNINVDVDIPNLKIGIVSYEQVNITISGTYASNITEIRYAGFNSSPTIMGYSGILDVYTSPAVNISNPNGNSTVNCCYSCDTSSSQSGCCTADQITDYFLQAFGGDLFLHLTQYAAWSTTNNISTGGNCCVGVILSIAKNNYVHNSSVNLSPNPSKDVFILSTENFDISEIDEIKVFDVLGRKQNDFSITSKTATTLEFDFSSLSPGMYFVQLRKGKERITERLILE